MVNNAGYIGHTGASSTAVSVVADIAESLDISGFTPAIAVSSLTVAAPIAVSGTVTTAAPANQNVSGISLDAIKVATEATQASTATLQADLGNLSGVLNTIVTTSAVDVSGTSLDAIKTSVELLDNAVDGNYLNINANIAGTDMVGGAGAVNAGTLRTTLATDDSSLPILTAIKVAVEDTTAVSGSITAAVSFPATTGITGGGTESAAQRVTIANDSTGSVGIKPSTSSYLSHVYIDLDATGDNPATNTEVIAAPGSGNKLVIYGVQGSIVGSAAAAAGNWYLSDGNTSAATTLWTGRAQGITNTQFELTFPYGVALTTNTALKVTSTEAANHIFINAVVYYRTEAV